MDNSKSTERALIDLFYAHAELTAATDPEAVARAIRHIEAALTELKSIAPRFEAKAARAA
ncbi:hypothetical protein M2323_001431 [Rhodoblastus acidophilus]|uniref:hypothetical protein n=1 Tax=Rhodoblastus acidophilus TaxID=1074 RepID=UPI002224F537|nr:hypothetical protein [Rhodoblastus acidophilus]MCW2283659.1 hypothetical protein [Rhodoblastus acidophilus]MCW2332519.1 hypothetical protein [Rhodoblastus acidophilus]